MWLRQTPLGWFILACGVVSLAALIAGGLTDMHVPEPGTLERLMGYPITVGVAAAGLVIAQRVQHERTLRKQARAQADRSGGGAAQPDPAKPAEEGPPKRALCRLCRRTGALGRGAVAVALGAGRSRRRLGHDLHQFLVPQL